MPMSMYELTQERKTATFVFDGGGSLTVTYRPNKVTPARELAILRGSATDDADSDDPQIIRNARANITNQISSFADMVESWDFMGPLARDADGEPLELPRFAPDQTESLEAYVAERGGTVVVGIGEPAPIEPDVLKLISSNFLMQLTRKINEDMRPNAPKRRD